MSVFIYRGGLNLVFRSGVGQAILHQEKALGKAGIDTTAKPDGSTSIIHINTLFPDSLAMLLRARMHKWKVVYFAHSTMEDFKRSFPLSTLLAPLFCRYLRFCLNRADIVITPTGYSKRLLLKYGVKRPVYPLSNGVDTSFFQKDREKGEAFRRKYGFGKEDKVVISVALPIERKGILEFIEIARKMEDVHFIWFGSLSSFLIPAKVKKAMRRAPQNVTFAGYVSQDELIGAYSGADCFLFMSHEETEGIVVLEALSSGIPAVLRSIPAYSALSEGERYPYFFSDGKECMDLLEKILYEGNPNDASFEVDIARKRDISEIGKAYRKIYQECQFI